MGSVDPLEPPPPCIRACGCELGMDRYGCTQPLAQCASDSSSDVVRMPGSRDFCLFCKREYVTSKIKVAQITNEAGILYKYSNTIRHLSIRSESFESRDFALEARDINLCLKHATPKRQPRRKTSYWISWSRL